MRVFSTAAGLLTRQSTHELFGFVTVYKASEYSTDKYSYKLQTYT